jgi:hypothetical protein
MLALGVMLALFVADPPSSPPLVGLASSGPCGTPILGQVPLAGAAPGLCVHEAFSARLEDPSTTDVVVQVTRPARPGAPAQEQLFIYRLSGEQLVPRFLGSGSPAVELVAVRRLPGIVRDQLEVLTRRGDAIERRVCRLEHFPLVCDGPSDGSSE